MDKLVSKILEAINNDTMNNEGKIITIQKLCEAAIYEKNRDKTCNTTEKKRIKTIEKFMDSVDYKPEICGYIMVSKEKATYTNGHMMATIPREFVANIQSKYFLPHMLRESFPDCSKVIPNLHYGVETCTLKYSDLVSFQKLAKIAKKGLRGTDRDNKDVFYATFSDSLIRAYNVNYLIHCCEVAGVNEITLTVPTGRKNVYVPATIDTENGCKFVVCGVKTPRTGEKAA